MVLSCFQPLLASALLAACVLAAPNNRRACTGTIASLDDVSDAVKCTTVNIESFTVPAGQTFNLELETGTTVNMRVYAVIVSLLYV